MTLTLVPKTDLLVHQGHRFSARCCRTAWAGTWGSFLPSSTRCAGSRSSNKYNLSNGEVLICLQWDYWL